tara:strand:- start:4433 stop:5284 length:852 start_codon:yes stop_codon:yes gene_type:complete
MKSSDSRLLTRLIARGDRVFIEKGRLSIEPKSGKDIDPDWLREHESDLIRSILRATKQTGYLYLDYSVGNFNGGKYPGISIRFREIGTEDVLYCCYGVDLKRRKTTSKGKKGKPLKKGHFHPPLKGKFVKMWQRIGLEKPRRNSEYHEKMGKLGDLVFSLSIDCGAKVHKDKVNGLDVPFAKIRDALLSDGEAFGNGSANTRQSVGNFSAIGFGTDNGDSEKNSGFRAISSPCEKHPEISKQKASYQESDLGLYKGSEIEVKKVEDQTNDEWSAAYRSPAANE